jgi:hypothetical protein
MAKAGPTVVLGYGILEWSFIVALVFLVGAAGLFALFLVAQLFRDHSRRRRVP